ncbi:MAG: hypothetical protein WC486_00375 [Candidatus Omnitrophota bacterium]
MGYSERLKKWSCENCKNLKRKTVTKKDLEGISKRVFLKAKDMHDYERLGLKFLLTYGLYIKVNRKAKNDGCAIFYCKNDLFKRRAYEVKENMKDSSVINKEDKCPRYK